VEGGRKKLAGAQAIGAALARGEPLRLIVLDGNAGAEARRALEAPAREAGVPLQTVGTRHFERLRPPGGPGGAVALLGPEKPHTPAEVLARPGPAWLLAGVVYPGNAGMAIRTAEVSGAAGVFVDADFDHAQRREATRASMRADRFLPVLWQRSHIVLDAAQAAGRRAIALEDAGTERPWQTDLTGPALFVVGSEHEGIAADVLARCDRVVAIPMAGFIRSYNLQAAVAIVAAERMRQLEAQGP
jgi:TrmH family RNA methyltransferase